MIIEIEIDFEYPIGILSTPMEIGDWIIISQCALCPLLRGVINGSAFRTQDTQTNVHGFCTVVSGEAVIPQRSATCRSHVSNKGYERSTMT